MSGIVARGRVLLSLPVDIATSLPTLVEPLVATDEMQTANAAG